MAPNSIRLINIERCYINSDGKISYDESVGISEIKLKSKRELISEIEATVKIK